MMKEKLVKYWKLIINSGLNIHKGQKLLISAPVECAEHVRMAAEEAYDAGAKQVIVQWADDKLTRLDFLRADDSIFDVCDPWTKTLYNSLSKEGAAFLNIYATDPENLKDADPDRILRHRKAFNKTLKAHRDRIMSNKVRWCVTSVPTESWAVKVFPDEAPQKAVEKLWDAIFSASRVDDGDALDNWRNHTLTLRNRSQTLNGYNFKYLIFKSANGTDLKVGLAEGHIWEGGIEKSQDGVEFSANIPSEEIFTCPNKTRVNGVVKCSKPLVYHGKIIDNFTVWFKDGKAIKVEAEKGQDLLEKLIKTDKNAAYLGEVALVPYHSPISESQVLFYNTLFDENAACHLAFGESYPNCVKGALGKSPKQLAKMGLNKSGIHEDFMIGTSDMDIIGIKHDGSEVQVFKNGDFVF